MFTPTSPAAPSPATVSASGDAIACSTSTQCTAVSATGTVSTFSPAAPGAPTTISLNDSARAGHAIACPSASECVVVDVSGNEIAFNPSAVGTPNPVPIDGTDALSALSCPAATECVAVDSVGGVVTFDPAGSGTPERGDIDAGRSLSSVACLTTTDCVIGDTAGNLLEGDPAVPTSFRAAQPAGANSIDSIACPAVSECVAVDAVGDIVVGTGNPPTNQSVPAISGRAIAGQTLTLTQGAWTNAPTITDQWQDCSADGTSCTASPGATGTSYTLSARDVGHTVRVAERAVNAGGTAGPVQSAATATVLPAHAPGRPTLRGRSLSLSRTKTTLRFKVHAGDNGAAKLKSLTVSLPKGLSFNAKAFRATKKCKGSRRHRTCRSTAKIRGLSVSRAGAFGAVLKHGALRISLARPATGAKVKITSPLIGATGSLAKQLKRTKGHAKKLKLTVGVKVTDATGKATVLSARFSDTVR